MKIFSQDNKILTDSENATARLERIGDSDCDLFVVKVSDENGQEYNAAIYANMLTAIMEYSQFHLNSFEL